MTNRPRALDLFCCGGGVSEGLRRAGFEVVGVDLVDHSRIYRRGPGRLCMENPATFVQADALEYLDAVCGIQEMTGDPVFDLICASPPCQAHSSLRHLQQGKEYPDLIPQTRHLLRRWGGLWCIENVPGAPLGGAHLTQLCGTMFGLQTPDGRAELRRHRLFETSFSIPLRPACQHGHESHRQKTVCVAGGKAMSGGMMTPQGTLKRRAISVVGACAEAKRPGWTGKAGGDGMDLRETFSTDDARHAMGIDWMPMKQLSQAIPPAYGEWIGRQALEVLRQKRGARDAGLQEGCGRT